MSVLIGRAGAVSGRLVAWAALSAAAGAIAFVAATRVQAPSLALAVGTAAGIAIGCWMFFSERMERPLIVFLLYLGLLDGFLKLRTNSSSITLGRDAMLYALAIGFLARATLRRQPLRLPPLSGWVLAFVVVVLMQVANPANTGLLHTLGALRPHLEFVPLFFVGYAMVQTTARLRTFFAVLVVIAVANGLVGLVQLQLSPAQLASWGPGYALRINGNGTGVDAVSGREYVTSTGLSRTRPFGLGDDSGVGAVWGMLALGGAVALLSLGMRHSVSRLALLLCLGPPLAIISGETRSVVIGSVIVLVAYLAFATTSRRLIPTLMATTAAIAVIAAVIAFVGSSGGSGVFERYLTLTPSKLIASTNQSRGRSFSAIPYLLQHHPLGNGLGGVGPAAGFAGGGSSGSNGETEPGFLISELGIPGLLVYYGFNLTLVVLGVARIRRLDPETRMFVGALLAGLIGLLIVGASAATTATSPSAPFLWFASGALAYWLTDRRGEDAARAGSDPLAV
jgi:hypothetical protein